MATHSGPDGRETLAQRFVAGALRFALKTFLKPGFRAGRPVEDQRRWLARVSSLTLAPRDASFTAATVGGVRGEWAEPKSGAAGAPVILYFHGGAYCVGSPATHRALTGHLALRCPARVFVADYRLAPEHPFPAAVDDGVAAYLGLLAEGVPPGRLVIAGDSAGGGLTLATALKLRELGQALPAALVVFSPWADLAPRGSREVPRGEAMIEPEWLDASARLYLGGRDPSDPLASPLCANLTGLPPALVQVGTDEVLLDDSRRLHVRLQRDGVEAALSVYPRRWHVFQANAGVLRDADRALDEAAAFIRDRTRP